VVDSTADSSADKPSLAIFNGLCVIPGSKNRDCSFFVCEGTGNTVYEADNLYCEGILRDHLFLPPSSEKSASGRFPAKNAKISFAQCVLLSNPNAMAIVMSSSYDHLDKIRLKGSNRRANMKQVKHDHCDDLFIFRYENLVNFCKGKTRAQKSEMCQLLKNDDGHLPSCTKELNIGYHLETVLSSLRRTREIAKNKFIMVMGRNHDLAGGNGNISGIVDLDLPGGKRHIGETVLKCLSRETFEETSIDLSEDCDIHENDDENFKEVDSSLQNCFYSLFPITERESKSTSVVFDPDIDAMTSALKSARIDNKDRENTHRQKL